MNNHTHKKVYIATQQGAHGNNKGAILLLGRDNTESFLGEGSEGTWVGRHSAVLDILTIAVADEALRQW